MKKIQYDAEGWIVRIRQEEIQEESNLQILEIQDKQWNKLFSWPTGYKWRYINNQVELQIYNQEEVDQTHLKNLRAQRQSLLQAFDIYKINVFYGIDSDANHQAILAWYQAILDLDEEAINTPPQEVAKYI